jgi:hypothetical protein
MGDGYSRSPLRFPGALIQFQTVPLINIPLPVPIIFQYNPESIARSLSPYSPGIKTALENAEAKKALDAGGTPPAQVQAHDPVETFTLNLLLDATDHLETPDTFPHQITVVTGVADRLAALEMLLYPLQSSVLGDLLADAASALGGSKPTKPVDQPKRVPTTLFVWGPGRIVPVRITSFSADEVQFNQLLYPHRAKVSMGMRVITKEEIKNNPGSNTFIDDIAIFCYDFTKAQKEVLALANIANTVESIILPFL